jgi:hypothetical protein
MAGDSRSSNWPLFIALKKAYKKPSARMRLKEIRMASIFI